jgi:hypothetical protein
MNKEPKKNSSQSNTTTTAAATTKVTTATTTTAFGTKSDFEKYKCKMLSLHFERRNFYRQKLFKSQQQQQRDNNNNNNNETTCYCNRGVQKCQKKY